MKKKFLKALGLFTVCLGCAIAVFYTLIAMSSQQTQAASFSSNKCLADSGADQVVSVQHMCNDMCPKSSGAPIGTLWFNGSNYNKNSNIVEVGDANKQSTTIYLWGQVFACKKKTTGGNNAQYIWFGERGQDNGDTRNGKNNLEGKVDFIENNNASLTLYRGTGTGEANTWYTPLGQHMEITLKIDAFKRYVERKISENSSDATKTENSDGTITYATWVSVNRCFSTRYNGYYKTSDKVCYGEDSEIRLKIPRSDTANSNFNSWSYASVKNENGGEVIGYFGTTENGPDGTAERAASTNSSKVTANFEHQLSYVHPRIEGEYSRVETSWNTKVTIDGVEQSNYSGKSGVYSPNTPGPAASDESSANDLGRVNVPVDVEAGKTKTVCSTIYYRKKYIVWNETARGSKKYVIDNNRSNGEASSTICVKISRGMGVSGGAVFSSQSFGETDVTTNDIAGDTSSKVDGVLASQDPRVSDIENVKGDAGLLQVRTDMNDSSVKLKFWHLIYYTPPADTSGSSLFKSADKVPNASTVSTHWTVTAKQTKLGARDSTGSATQEPWRNVAISSVTQGNFSPQDLKRSDTSEKIPYTAMTTNTGTIVQPVPVEITVNLDKDETALVCSTINYTPKRYTFKVDKHNDGILGHDLDHLNYEYKIDQRGESGSSQFCISVYRPREPQGTPWSGGLSAGGTAISKIMFAGEETKIGWNVYASGDQWDRIAKIQYFNYTVSANTSYNQSILDGPKTYRGDLSNSGPCNYTKALWQNGGRCTVISTDSVANYTFHSSNRSPESIISPNEVGMKHGNSVAYYYERWHYTCHTSHALQQCTPYWHINENDPGYWYVYNTASRTVAKKPSIAFWNGGVSTGVGNAKTSVAPRYTNQRSINYLPVSGDPTYFGSWTEYLAAIGGSVSGFTSGASLAVGRLQGSSFDLLANSPLTISNDDGSRIGYSGISSNGILRERLQQYFFNSQNVSNVFNVGNTYGGVAFGPVSGTTVIKSSGDLKIDGNIIVDHSGSRTIYDIPQVLIYAQGDIEIASDVTRIDAWLVTDGVLYTCDIFRNGRGGTEARIGHNGNYISTNNECGENLQINGPVFASRLIARRTYGADGISNDDIDTAGRIDDHTDTHTDTRAATAEVFNLSAMNYIWAYAQGGRYNSSYTEAYSRELPPRY